MNGNIKILLIEDDPADAMLLSHSLKESFNNQFDLTKSGDLSHGLNELLRAHFDVVILDLSLPDSIGLDSFKRIHENCQDTPVIVLTGMEDELTGINAVKMGAQDFLIKGKIKSKTLSRSINYSIERNALLKQLSENTKKLEERTNDLLREKQKLSEAQKLAHIGSWELDIESNTLTLSEELCNIYGVKQGIVLHALDDLIGYVHPSERESVKGTITNSCTTSQNFNLHHRIIRPNGEVRTLHAMGEIVADEQGRAIKILGTGQDVTERFHEEELEKLVLAATKSFNSVVIRDKEGKIEWVNEGFTKLCGYYLEDVKNTFGEILQSGNGEYFSNQGMYYSRVVKEKIPVSFENMNYAKDGKGFWTITTLTPVLGKDNEVERIIAIDSDITLRRQMEEELLQANKIAEHSLMKGNKALTELMIAKKQVEESMKVKEQFLANMSHEIRTPMNAIVGFTSLLLKTPISIDQRQYIDAIKTSGENLLVIINDILDFSKIQSGKINFEQIELQLSTGMSSLTEMMLPKSVEKNIKLSTKIDKRIHDYLIGDPTRLNQILVNLVGNAIKFTERGEIRIAVDLLEETEEAVKLKFSVSDTGIGIAKEKLNSIFEGFTQATNDTTRKYGGTGLGLSIVKQLVELQGGTIQVESHPGKGSVFSFNLSFKKNHRKREQNNGFSREEEFDLSLLRGLKVLLVEDNVLNQVLARKVLSDWEWEVDVADNGLVAIEKMARNDFDLILMDIQLPEMDGYEATRYIRKKLSDPKRNIPIIAMTAHAIAGEAEKCFLAGMNEYVSKPFDPRDLYTKIAQVLNNRAELIKAQKTTKPTKVMSNHTTVKNTDLEYLRQLSNGSKEFIVQMISIFQEQTPQAIQTLEQSLVKQDWIALRATAHKMKPSFGFMGIKSLKELIVNLEEEAEKGANPEGMREKIATIREVCNQAIVELEQEKNALA
jgi:PAS domain S-box-containing protein